MLSEPQAKLLLKVKEAAEMLSISERTLFTHTKEGRIKATWIRGCKRYDIEEIRAVIQRSKGE